jgi:hypothetical protein
MNQPIAVLTAFNGLLKSGPRVLSEEELRSMRIRFPVFRRNPSMTWANLDGATLPAAPTYSEMNFRWNGEKQYDGTYVFELDFNPPPPEVIYRDVVIPKTSVLEDAKRLVKRLFRF